MGERCAVVVSRRQVRPGLFQDGTGQGGVAFVRLGVGQSVEDFRVVDELVGRGERTL